MAFTPRDLQALLDSLAVRFAAERDALCRLDGLIGDGDHGIAMAEGMRAAAASAAAVTDGTLQDQFNAAAKGFLNAVGASSGPLYATAFLRAGKAAGPVTDLPGEGLRAVIAAMAEGIAFRGKAVPGQKTMLDAWAPAAAAALAGGDGAAIVAAAEAGRDATAAMQASLGRAARLGERALGHIDPGAASAVMIIAALVEALEP